LITTYEVRNVLRVYGNQLKRKSSQFDDSGSVTYGSVDLVDISMGARRRHLLSQISNQLISRITPAGERDREEEQQDPASKLLSNVVS
jgi:hypothetical protein